MKVAQQAACLQNIAQELQVEAQQSIDRQQMNSDTSLPDLLGMQESSGVQVAGGVLAGQLNEQTRENNEMEQLASQVVIQTSESQPGWMEVLNRSDIVLLTG